ncbi:BTAD domain-containing putative transcriptional regulator [Streptomyces sp. NPDC020192]|uniref:AfsR/SARP family transcriptional regulator n=1 Tax=Streptomyces sp. NPDC020192 TaxID=3365066 RepID=UPI0037935137
MNISILGPFDAHVAGRRITPTAAKPATLLALLVVERGRTIALDDCIRELWPDRVPRTANAAIHTYISKLRETLTAAAPGMDPKTVLRTRPGGYLLTPHTWSSDQEGFERLTERGHRAAAAGDDAAASVQFRRALALWKGTALSSIETGPLLQRCRVELEERRKAAYARCVAAELRLGLHYELLGELVAQAAADRTDEQLHANLMLALYRVGRRVQALQVYRNLRHQMVTELGLEPSPGVRALQRAILNADSSPHLVGNTAQDRRTA